METYSKIGTCLYCGKQFTKTQSKHKYCSGRCKEAYRLSKLELHEGICKGCGAKILYKLYAGKPSKVYCSTACQVKHTVPTKTLKCVDCGAEFTFVGRTRRLRCNDCWAKHRISSAVAQHQLQQENSAAAGVSIMKYRSLVLTGNDCCSVCGYRKDQDALVVHHLDTNRYNNVKENLRILCANCHTILHKRIKRYKKSSEATPEQVYEYMIAEVKDRNEAGTPTGESDTEGCEELQSGATHTGTSRPDMSRHEADPIEVTQLTFS